MPYTPTVFYNNAPPQITAAELNKLGAGVARADSTADAAVTAATDANTDAIAAAAAAAGRWRAVRTQPGDIVQGTSLTPDTTLTLTITGLGSKIFLVQYSLVYQADTACLGDIGLTVTNGSAYWLAMSAPVGDSIHYSDATTTGVRFGLLGTPTAPRIVTGYAHVLNASGDITIGISTAETVSTVTRAQPGSGMQLMPGSLLTVEQLD